jgi:hypothetical protein
MKPGIVARTKPIPLISRGVGSEPIATLFPEFASC